MTITPDAAARAAATLPGDHRWELTPEGSLVIISLRGVDEAAAAARLIAWFVGHGLDPEQVLPEVGIHTVREGLRGPDLAVFDEIPEYLGPWAAIDRLRIVIEVVSPSTRRVDETEKMDEYAIAGIPRYWLVVPQSGGGAIVRMYELDGSRRYVEAATLTLDELTGHDPRRYVYQD